MSRARVRLRDDGQIEVKLKTAWHDGTTHLLMSPMDFISRLVSLVPAPKLNVIRYHGVFAPASPLRKSIIPQEAEDDSRDILGDSVGGCGHEGRAEKGPSKYHWASLMKRVFDVDVLECPKCKSRMQQIAFITDRNSIRDFLEHVGLFGNSPPEIDIL